MSKKKIAALLAALMVTLSCLSACSNQNETNKKGSNAGIATAQAEEEKKPVTKVFEPGTHIFTKRYSYNFRWSVQRQVIVPDGYEVLHIDNFFNGSTSYTKGFDVWFINVETVEATESTISTDMNKTEKGYYNPGIVVKKETTLELTNGN